MINSTRGLVVVAVLTLVASLVILFPARVAYHWTSPSQLTASGIKGTVWRGGADAIEANGVVLVAVRWHIRPLQLFRGRVGYRVEGSPVSGFFESDIGLGLGGAVYFSDLSAALPLTIFAQPLKVRGLRGEATLQFEEIELRDGLPVAATGSAAVNNLVTPMLGAASIGSYRAEFFTTDDGIAASIEDTDAVVDLAGSLEVNGDGSYQLLGKISEKPATPAAFRRQLQFLGSPDDRGQREFRLEGSL